jgi:glutathione S-transferase
MNRPTLYVGTLNASSWAFRAWLALKAAGYEFDRVIVDIRRPQRFENLARLSSMSPSASVPILDTGQAIVYDSLAIMEFANELVDGALLPRDIEARAQARSLMAWQHAGLSSLCKRISFESAFYPARRSLDEAERSECARLLSHYEVCLQRSGGPFLFGSLSLADLMHVPTVIRLSSHGASTAGHPETGAWMRTMQALPWVREWMEEAYQLPHIWLDDYLTDDAWPGSVVS